MKRGRRLLLVSHCVLNQNSVVHPLARSRGGLVEVVKVALDAGAGIVQLPCPEMAFGGLCRMPATREQYDTLEYRRLCDSLAELVAGTIRPMLGDGCEIIGVLGIAGSPSCAVTSPRGIWMESLLGREALARTRVFEVPDDSGEKGRGLGEAGDFLGRFKAALGS